MDRTMKGSNIRTPKIYRKMDRLRMNRQIDRLIMFIGIQCYDGNNQYQNSCQPQDIQKDGWIYKLTFQCLQVYNAMMERINIRTPATPRRIGIICSDPDWQRLPSKPHLKRFSNRIVILNLNLLALLDKIIIIFL